MADESAGGGDSGGLQEPDYQVVRKIEGRIAGRIRGEGVG